MSHPPGEGYEHGDDDRHDGRNDVSREDLVDEVSKRVATIKEGCDEATTRRGVISDACGQLGDERRGGRAYEKIADQAGNGNDDCTHYVLIARNDNH